MRREWIGKLAVVALVVMAAGGIAGVALADFVESGSFAFYRGSQVAEWRPEPIHVAPIETADLSVWPPFDDSARPGSQYATYER